MDMHNVNDQVERLIRERKFGRLADMCRSIISAGQNSMDKAELYRLTIFAGYALFEEKRFRDSYDLVYPLYRSDYFPVDTLYLLTADLLLMEKYTEALALGEEFIAALDSVREQAGTFLLGDVISHAHELCNNLGSAGVKCHNYGKAVFFFRKGIGYNSRYELLYENLAAVYSFENKWAEVIKTALEGIGNCPWGHELKRVQGIALDRLYKYGEAVQAFTGAAEAGSVNARADLGALYQRMSKFREAAHWLSRYLEADPENADVSRAHDAIISSGYHERNEPRISAALIVKDEEEMLEQCLESIRDAVDEIVVVDTGSKDRTAEIARRYTDAVYHHQWQDSFSEARNYSISRATGDWILIIDADEVLDKEHILKVREYKWSPDHDCFCFAVYSQLPGHLGGVNQGKHYSPRLFRRRDDIYYEGIVHNVLRMPDKTAMTDINLFHFGYDLRQDKMNRKFHRSLNLLLKQIEDDPANSFVRYNIAQMYLSRGYFLEAKEHAEKILEILTPDDQDQIHIYLMGLYQLVLVYMRTGEMLRAEEYGRQALEVKPNYIDPMLALGWVYYLDGRYQDSENILDLFIKTCNDLREDNDFNMVILNKLGSEFEAYYVLGEIYLRRGRPADAELLLNKSIELNPYFWQSYKCLGKIAFVKEDYDSADKFFEQAIKLGYLNVEKYGTTGAPKAEYAELLAEYKALQFKLIDSDRTGRSLDDALGDIDKFLSRE